MTKTISLRNFDFANLTDKGLQRVKNEDFLAYFDTVNGYVFVLCDGMGGHNAGEYASELAVESIGEFLDKKYIKNPFDAVENAIKYANHEVHTKSNANPNYKGMGTTIVMTLIRDNRIYYGHVGDSRIYHFSDGKLHQITKDHSFVQKLIDEGIISEAEAETHPRKNEISKALGLTAFVEPEVSPSALIPENDDFLLLCSDGLTNMVDDENIEKELINTNKIIDSASRFIDLANVNGGEDNISVQLVKFHNITFEDEKDIYSKKLLSQILGFVKFNKRLILLIVFLIVILLSFIIVLNQKNRELKSDLNKVKSPMFLLKKVKNQVIVYAYRLQSGDTYEIISEKFNIDVSVLRALNPNINQIVEGRHFKIIIRDFYTVKSGDDLGIILLLFKVNEIDLMKANNFCDKQIHIGQELIIPIY